MNKVLKKIVEAIKEFIAAIKRITSVAKPSPEVTTTLEQPIPPVAPVTVESKPVTVVETTPTAEEEEEQEESVVTTEQVKPDKPQPKTPVKILEGGKFISGKDGSGGFVNNPNSSRGTLKIIFPSKYTDKIVEVVVWVADGSFVERLYNKQPGEWGNRERYYGKKKIKDYPKNLIVGARLEDGSVICIKVPDPQVRQD